MMIYHGCDPDDVETILSDGLHPRKATDKSNWDERNMESISNHVYVTDRYAPYFSMAARNDMRIGIVEIDLDKLPETSLYPDEDFIEQAIQMDLEIEYPEWLDLSGDLASRTAAIRENIELFQPYWKNALDLMGNISHRGHIPPNCISRGAVSDPPSQIRMDIDPNISIQNAQLTGYKYVLITRLLMGDPVTEDEYMKMKFGVPVPGGGGEYQMMPDEQIEQIKQTSNFDISKVLSQDYVDCIHNPNYTGSEM